MLTGQNGILTKAAESSFRTEMSGIEEKVKMRNAEVQIDGKSITEIFTEQVKIEDVKKWDDQLKLEIIYWGEYDIGVNTVSRKYVKQNWESILTKNQAGKEYVENLYYIDKGTADGKEKAYLYDTKVGMVYKVKPTGIGKYKVHSLKELDYQKNNNEGERNVLTEGTLITQESKIIKMGNVACYEPDLAGFVVEKTKAVYYKDKENGETQEESIEEPISEYLSKDGDRVTVTKGNKKYEFFNYETKKWANVKVENSGIVTYWVWIPRYAYKLNGTETDIIFVDLDNKNAETGEDLDDGYIVHSAFSDGQKGTWVSKYETSQVKINEVTDYSYYIPDLDGFNKETTYIEVYEENKGFKEYKLSEIGDIKDFSKKNKWFDYENKIWANIKTVSDGMESWWVWIPRYAYNISGTTTSIMFVDTSNNPLSGGKLPSNYVVHPAFSDGLKGIWTSKYEVSPKVGDREKTNDVNEPDMDGFNPDTTYIELYNDDGTFTEKKLSEIGDLKEFISKNRWYDYSKQIWANIKVVSDGVESWWVWIPRYAYNITGIETEIIFLREDSNNPRDGSTLPSNYVVHPAFSDGKKGIWTSKYEVNKK